MLLPFQPEAVPGRSLHASLKTSSSLRLSPYPTLDESLPPSLETELPRHDLKLSSSLRASLETVVFYSAGLETSSSPSHLKASLKPPDPGTASETWGCVSLEPPNSLCLGLELATFLHPSLESPSSLHPSWASPSSLHPRLKPASSLRPSLEPTSSLRL